MKKLTVFAMLLIAGMASGQPYKFNSQKEKNKYLTMAGMMFVSGYARGMEQVINYKYNSFAYVHPKANQWYWNPKISWRNKYKDRAPYLGPKFAGSTGVLVWTTDAKHMLDAVNNIGIYGTITISLTSKFSRADLKDNIIRSLALIGCRYAGFHTSYNLVYRAR